MKPLRNIDVSRKGYEGLHQLRVFLDVTPEVTPNAGVFVLLVNQQQRGTTELQPHHPAWYTGQIELDAVPVRFLDLDKLYYALEDAKRLQEKYEKEQAPVIDVQTAPEAPVTQMPRPETRPAPGAIAARIRVPKFSVPKIGK